MRKRVRRIVACADVAGDVDRLERLLDRVADDGTEAVALVGNLAGGPGGPRRLKEVLQVLGESGVPAYLVPGPDDAPISEWLREAWNMEIVFPNLHGVHGAFAFAPGWIAFAGLGGLVEDDRDRPRDEQERLVYPGWEAEYRLKPLANLKDYPKVFLFATPPVHKGRQAPGSQTIAELIKTHNPRVAVVAGDEPYDERLGPTLVVSPGALAEGRYATVALDEGEARFDTL